MPSICKFISILELRNPFQKKIDSYIRDKQKSTTDDMIRKREIEKQRLRDLEAKTKNQNLPRK